MNQFLKANIWDVVMGIQYLFVAIGATILVPILTGIPVTAVLFTAGTGTLLFHIITKGKVPVLLSSSFAFIAPIIIVSELYGQAYAFGGIFVAGIIYLLLAVFVYFVGIDFISKLFPPVVASTMVILIGLILAPIAIKNASVNWFIAIATLGVGITIKFVYEGSFLGSLSIIMSIIIGSIFASFHCMGYWNIDVGLPLLALPNLTFPQFSIAAITLIAPIAIVTFLEHFADISAVSKVVEKDFLKDPGVHRTLIGDGLATAFAGLLGGCPNTTYSENIGALELTGVKKPVTLRITAICLIILSFFPMLAALLHSIPTAVIGGISILLFGMIASSGLKGLINEKVDMKNYCNMIIVATMLVIGVGGTVVTIGAVQVSSLALAALIGVVLNIGFNYKTVFNLSFKD